MREDTERTAGEARPGSKSSALARTVSPLHALAWAALALGLFLRVLEYTANRMAYMDETGLLRNLLDLPILDFHTTLSDDQLAPPAFLVVERLMVRLPLHHVQTGRFVPFLFGIASMFLMWSVAR